MFSMQQRADKKRILAMISERGGGDAPPVLTLGSALQRRGHSVSVLCDTKTESIVGVAGLEPVLVPFNCENGAKRLRRKLQIRLRSGQKFARLRSAEL